MLSFKPTNRPATHFSTRKYLKSFIILYGLILSTLRAVFRSPMIWIYCKDFRQRNRWVWMDRRTAMIFFICFGLYAIVSGVFVKFYLFMFFPAVAEWIYHFYRTNFMTFRPTQWNAKQLSISQSYGQTLLNLGTKSIIPSFGLSWSILERKHFFVLFPAIRSQIIIMNNWLLYRRPWQRIDSTISI